MRAALREKLDFVYPWGGSVDLPSKLTATELKDPLEADADAAPMQGELPATDFRHAAPGKDRTLNAVQRGTATHTFLQYVDFARTASREELRAEAERLTAEGRLDASECAVLDLAAVEKLFSSPLGREMRAASTLRREFRFQLLCAAAEYFPGAAAEDEILLQGVVDCYWEDEDGITVVDYKTDWVADRQAAEERAKHYRPQLRTYARALERICRKPVKECTLYFLGIGEAVSVEE